MRVGFFFFLSAVSLLRAGGLMQVDGCRVIDLRRLGWWGSSGLKVWIGGFNGWVVGIWARLGRGYYKMRWWFILGMWCWVWRLDDLVLGGVRWWVFGDVVDFLNPHGGRWKLVF